jgi:hypothetical protein
VAQFAQKNSIRELMENLTGLVDEYTEYFKSQLDALAPKERRVFLAFFCFFTLGCYVTLFFHFPSQCILYLLNLY